MTIVNRSDPIFPMRSRNHPSPYAAPRAPVALDPGSAPAPVLPAGAMGDAVRRANEAPFGLRAPAPRIVDPIALLPPEAAAKLRALRERYEDLRTIVLSLSDRRVEASQEVQRRRNRLRQVEEQVARLRATTPSAAGEVDPVETSRRDLAEAERELAELNERHGRLTQQLAAIPAPRIDAWLKQRVAEGARFAPAPPVEPKLPKNKTLADALAEVRGQRDELRADLHEVRSSATPAAVVKARMREQIAALAERGEPDCLAGIERGAPIRFAMRAIESYTPPDPLAGRYHEHGVADTLGLVAWLFRDELIARLDTEIDELADPNAIDDAERAKRERALLDGMLELDRVEEALIGMAEAAGVPAQRRPAAAAAAVLGIVVVGGGNE